MRPAVETVDGAAGERQAHVLAEGLQRRQGERASAPLLTSFYYDRAGNYDGAFLAIAALAVLGSVLLLFARKPEPVAAEPERVARPAA